MPLSSLLSFLLYMADYLDAHHSQYCMCIPAIHQQWKENSANPEPTAVRVKRYPNCSHLITKQGCQFICYPQPSLVFFDRTKVCSSSSWAKPLIISAPQYLRLNLLQRQLISQRPHNRVDAGKLRIPIFRQRLLQPLAGNPCRL